MERPATRNNKQKFKQMKEEDRAAGTVAKAKERLVNVLKFAQPKAYMAGRAKEAPAVSMELLRVTGGHNQTSRHLKTIFISASWKIPTTL